MSKQPLRVSFEKMSRRVTDVNKTIELIEYNGVRKPCKLRCKVCGYEWRRHCPPDRISTGTCKKPGVCLKCYPYSGAIKISIDVIKERLHEANSYLEMLEWGGKRRVTDKCKIYCKDCKETFWVTNINSFLRSRCACHHCENLTPELKEAMRVLAKERGAEAKRAFWNDRKRSASARKRKSEMMIAKGGHGPMMRLKDEVVQSRIKTELTWQVIPGTYINVRKPLGVKCSQCGFERKYLPMLIWKKEYSKNECLHQCPQCFPNADRVPKKVDRSKHPWRFATKRSIEISKKINEAKRQRGEVVDYVSSMPDRA